MGTSPEARLPAPPPGPPPITKTEAELQAEIEWQRQQRIAARGPSGLETLLMPISEEANSAHIRGRPAYLERPASVGGPGGGVPSRYVAWLWEVQGGCLVTIHEVTACCASHFCAFQQNADILYSLCQLHQPSPILML